MNEIAQGYLDLRVAVLAEDGIGASALIALLADQQRVEPVVQIDPKAYESLAEHPVDVVLADIGRSFEPESLSTSDKPLPEAGRIENLPTVGLVSDSQQAAEAWRAGYRSLVLRSESPVALVAALQAAAAGLWVLSPQLADSLSTPTLADANYQFDELTHRELEVLALVAEGMTNRAIAHQLDISEHTVKFHVNSILSKLGAESRTDAVVRATRAGLILL